MHESLRMGWAGGMGTARIPAGIGGMGDWGEGKGKGGSTWMGRVIVGGVRLAGVKRTSLLCRWEGGSSADDCMRLHTSATRLEHSHRGRGASSTIGLSRRC